MEDVDTIDYDILNGKKYPTDKHLDEERARWKKEKKRVKINLLP